MDNVQPSRPELTREEVDRLPGPVLLEFGAEWCPHCQAIAPQLQAVLERYPQVKHLRFEDGKGKPLGRSFQVKLWPNLVFLVDGQVKQQLARPDIEQVRDGLASLVQATP